jgi:hypothetical protein
MYYFVLDRVKTLFEDICWQSNDIILFEMQYYFVLD